MSVLLLLAKTAKLGSFCRYFILEIHKTFKNIEPSKFILRTTPAFNKKLSFSDAEQIVDRATYRWRMTDVRV